MIRRLLLLTSLVAFAFSAVADTDEAVQARKVALELAGAFSNDGFKIRDGHWSAPLKGGDTALIAVNLYAGNQYWFSVGAHHELKPFTVAVHDENGKPMTTEGYQSEDKAAAGFSPTVSGQYFVSIAPSEPAETTYCLVYSYK
ncbi:hypothetical protein BH20VER1_BH20VER1_15150 [soil metagenome]